MDVVLKEIIAGTVGGIAGVVATQPLDLLKGRMQAAAAGTTSVTATAANILRKEGFLAFFKGMGAPIAANAPINAIIFGVERAANRWLSTVPSISGPDGKGMMLHVLSGALSGLATVPITIPTEFTKLQMQMQSSSAATSGGGGAYKGSFHCAASIARQYGARTLFRGGSLTFVRDTMAFAWYFSVYHWLKGVLLALPLPHAWTAAPPPPPSDSPRPVPLAVSTPAVALSAPAAVSASSVALAAVAYRPPAAPPVAGASAAAPAAASSSSSSSSSSTSSSSAAAAAAIAAGIGQVMHLDEIEEYLPPLSVDTGKGSVYATTLALMLAGGTAGVASWLFTYPADILKTLVQTSPLASTPQQRSVRAIFAREMAAHGPRFLTKGLSATLLRAFPNSAVTFPVFEFMMGALEGGDEGHTHQEDLPMR